jgi:hypothetical protein
MTWEGAMREGASTGTPHSGDVGARPQAARGSRAGAGLAPAFALDPRENAVEAALADGMTTAVGRGRHQRRASTPWAACSPSPPRRSPSTAPARCRKPSSPRPIRPPRHVAGQRREQRVHHRRVPHRRRPRARLPRARRGLGPEDLGRHRARAPFWERVRDPAAVRGAADVQCVYVPPWSRRRAEGGA